MVAHVPTHINVGLHRSKIVFPLVMFLPEGIVGRHYLLSFGKGLSSVPFAKRDTKGSIEAPFLSI